MNPNSSTRNAEHGKRQRGPPTNRSGYAVQVHTVHSSIYTPRSIPHQSYETSSVPPPAREKLKPPTETRVHSALPTTSLPLPKHLISPPQSRITSHQSPDHCESNQQLTIRSNSNLRGKTPVTTITTKLPQIQNLPKLINQ